MKIFKAAFAILTVLVLLNGCGGVGAEEGASEEGTAEYEGQTEEGQSEEGQSEEGQTEDSDIITTAAVSVESGSAENIPLTFGHTFRKGDIPSGARVALQLNSQAIPTQMDIKATHNDGSIRHAVVSTLIPSLGTTEKSLKINLDTNEYAPPIPISIDNVLDSGFDTGIDITLHNVQVNKLTFGDRSTSWHQGDVITLNVNGKEYSYTVNEGTHAEGDDIGADYTIGMHAAIALEEAIKAADSTLRVAHQYEVMYISGTGDAKTVTVSAANSGSAPVTDEVVQESAPTNNYHIDIKTALQAAKNSYTPDQPTYIEWLKGDIASEWIITAPLIDSQTQEENPNLQARLSIRAYGNLAAIKTDIVIENSWSYPEAPRNFCYDVAVSSNGETAFTADNITHYRQGRWKKTIWWGDHAETNMRHNMRYLMASKAIPNYDQNVVAAESSLAAYEDIEQAENYSLMHIGSATPYMPQTGEHLDIGPLPTWQALYAVSGDKRVKRATELNSDLAGTWSIHYRDKETGYPITIDEWPYMTILGRSTDTWNSNPDGDEETDDGRYEAFPECAGYCHTPYTHDSAHQPTFSYLPYLITGDYYHLEELQFWANYNLLSMNPGSRDQSQGLFKGGQLRGQAWSMRTLGQAAYITPDNHPLKTYFANKLENNINWYNETYTNNSEANKLGIMVNGYILGYNDNRGTAPWQQDFFTWAIGSLVDYEFNGAQEMVEWMSKFQIGRMNKPEGTSGYNPQENPEFCWIYGTSYTLNVRDSQDSPFYETMDEVYRASVDDDIEILECASQAMANAMGLEQAGTMDGYAYYHSGYTAYFQAALALVVDYGSTDANTAWNTFEGRAVKPDFSLNPKFAITPRKLNQTENYKEEIVDDDTEGVAEGGEEGESEGVAEGDNEGEDEGSEEGQDEGGSEGSGEGVTEEGEGETEGQSENHLEQIASLNSNEWIILNPEGDPEYGMARARAWGGEMAYAPELGGGLLYGEGVHGWWNQNPESPGFGHYMDDLWFYDIETNSWETLYPGYNVNPVAKSGGGYEPDSMSCFPEPDEGQSLRDRMAEMTDDEITNTNNCLKEKTNLCINSDGVTATSSAFGEYPHCAEGVESTPLAVSTMVHGYEMLAWDGDREQFLSMTCSGGYYDSAIPEYRYIHTHYSDLLNNRVSPWIFDMNTRQWDRHPAPTTDDRYVSSPMGAVMHYLPDQQKTFFWNHMSAPSDVNNWFYDNVNQEWNILEAGGTPPPFGIDGSSAYDPVRKRIYMGGGAYPSVEIGENPMWIYDTEANTWTDPQPTGDSVGTSFSTNNNILHYDTVNDVLILFRHGACDEEVNRCGIFIYDPVENNWTKTDGAPLWLEENYLYHRSVSAFYSPEYNAHFFWVALDSDDNGRMFVYRYNK